MHGPHRPDPAIVARVGSSVMRFLFLPPMSGVVSGVAGMGLPAALAPSGPDRGS